MENQPADLEIRILERQQGGYPVELTLDGQEEFPRGYLPAGVLPWVPGADPAADGRRLFEQLLADPEIRTAWAEAHGRTSQRRLRLRLRLRIDPASAELHSLPWELLQEDGVVLSAGAATPFSRYLPVALPWGGPLAGRPLRILAVISAPADIETAYQMAPIDYAAERQALEAVLGGLPGIQLDFLEPPVTLEKLQAALQTGYPIWHFLGHGRFSQRAQKAALYFQNPDGNTRLVVDDDLAGLLARQDVHPRLVFLSACQSAARAPTPGAPGAFLGLAPKLVAVGVPAVVAMQDRIEVDTARQFTSAFYRRLLEDGLVDAAMNAARSTLLSSERPDAVRLLDAAGPVLFMRLKSGQLWGAEADARGSLLGEKDPEDVWKFLLDHIQRGKCTPVIGPRVHGRWLPAAEQVAQAWAGEYGYPFAGGESSMARVSQYLATTRLTEYLPHDQWLKALQGQFYDRLPDPLKPDHKPETLTELVQAVGFSELAAGDPNEPHRVLAGLNLPLYLTTNCDSFMTAALQARPGVAPAREACRWKAGLDDRPSLFDGSRAYEPTPAAPLVYHLFGRDDDLESLALTEDNFLDFLTRIGEAGRIPDFIRGRLGSTSLMLVGYSLNDLEFRVLLRGLVATSRRQSRYVNVAVQIEGASQEDAGAVQDYLRKYLEQARINVFWGSCVQFIAELRERWEAVPR